MGRASSVARLVVVGSSCRPPATASLRPAPQTSKQSRNPSTGRDQKKGKRQKAIRLCLLPSFLCGRGWTLRYGSFAPCRLCCSDGGGRLPPGPLGRAESIGRNGSGRAMGVHDATGAAASHGRGPGRGPVDRTPGLVRFESSLTNTSQAFARVAPVGNWRRRRVGGGARLGSQRPAVCCVRVKAARGLEGRSTATRMQRGRRGRSRRARGDGATAQDHLIWVVEPGRCGVMAAPPIGP